MLQIGETLDGRYRIDDLIGKGGEGDTHAATDTASGQRVAIKQLDPAHAASPRSVQRFHRAGRVSDSILKHPNILTALELLETDGGHYLVTPLVEGCESLDVFVGRRGRLPPEVAVALFVPLADALRAMHQAGILHRDIKPANILIAGDGTPLWIDFGICRFVHEQTLSNGEVLGTPGWMSPEQTRSPLVDERSDLFAFGLVMYFVLAGVSAVPGGTDAQLMKFVRNTDLRGPGSAVAGIPPYLDAICTRLLARKPEKRFLSADELCRALAQGALPSRFCVACGTAVEGDTRFCTHCGADQEAPDDALCLACRTPTGMDVICRGCGRPFSPRDHRLVFHTGTAAGTIFRIPEGIFTIGRQEIEPRDASISRQHVRVCCVNGSVVIQDAGSANKTYVQGQPAERPCQLESNQEVAIAFNRARYLSA